MMKAKNLRTLISAAVAQAYQVQAEHSYKPIRQEGVLRYRAANSAYQFCKAMAKVATTDPIHDKKFGLLYGLKFAAGSKELALATEAAHAIQPLLANIRPAMFNHSGSWLKNIDFGFHEVAPLPMTTVTNRGDSDTDIAKTMALHVVSVLRQHIATDYAMGAGLAHHLGLPEHNTPLDGYVSTVAMGVIINFTMYDDAGTGSVGRTYWCKEWAEFLASHDHEASRLSPDNVGICYQTFWSEVNFFFTVDHGTPVAHFGMDGAAHPVPKVKYSGSSVNTKLMLFVGKTFLKQALKPVAPTLEADAADTPYGIGEGEIKVCVAKGFTECEKRYASKLPKGIAVYPKYTGMIPDKHDDLYFKITMTVEFVSVPFSDISQFIKDRLSYTATFDADYEDVGTATTGAFDALAECYAKFLASPEVKAFLSGTKIAPPATKPSAPPKVAPPAVKPPVKVAPPAPSHGQPVPEINEYNPTLFHPTGAKFEAYLQALTDKVIKDASIVHKLPDGASMVCKVLKPFTKETGSLLYFEVSVRIIDITNNKTLWSETGDVHNVKTTDEYAIKGGIFNVAFNELKTFLKTDIAKRFMNPTPATKVGPIDHYELSELWHKMNNWRKLGDPRHEVIPYTNFNDLITVHIAEAVRDGHGKTKLHVLVSIENESSGAMKYRAEYHYEITKENQEQLVMMAVKLAAQTMTAWNKKANIYQ